MADPQHVAELDDFDTSTVRLYRASIAAAATALLLGSAVYTAGGLGGQPVVGVGENWVPLVWTLLVYATGACMTNLHLYARRIKWIVQALAWVGATLLVAAYAVPGETLGFWLEKIGLGFVFATWSAVALKEQFCFKFPWMRLVPWFLAASLAPLCANMWLPAGLLLLASGSLLVLLASKKQSQPLHYDIGDKSKYEI